MLVMTGAFEALLVMFHPAAQPGEETVSCRKAWPRSCFLFRLAESRIGPSVRVIESGNRDVVQQEAAACVDGRLGNLWEVNI